MNNCCTQKLLTKAKENETVRCTVKNLGGTSVLVYRLVKNRVYEEIDGYEPCTAECYSLSILKLTGRVCRDERTLPDISRNFDEANRLYSLFARNSVTPECACEIIDDLLAM